MPDQPRPSAAATAFALAGGLLFATSLGYAVVTFATTWATPPPAPAPGLIRAVCLDLALFSVFALHHSLFARVGLKQWVAGDARAHLERPIYVWVASLLFLATMWAWVPVPGLAWSARPPLSFVLALAQIAGVVITLDASRQLGIFELAGIRRPRPSTNAATALRDRGYYGFVRHPIYFAWLLMVWCTPAMTGSRLTFAIISTMYLVIAVPLEERTLRRDFGATYDAYCQRVRWRMMPGVY